MSATVLPFRRTTSNPLVVTAEERAYAALWCAQRGPAWSASAITSDHGGVSLWIEREGQSEGEEVAWFVERGTEGLSLVVAASCRPVGVFSTMRAALAALEGVEG